MRDEEMGMIKRRYEGLRKTLKILFRYSVKEGYFPGVWIKSNALPRFMFENAHKMYYSSCA